MDVDSAGAPSKTSFGRIIRDVDGNIIDIIIEGEEKKDEGAEEGAEAGAGVKRVPLNPVEKAAEVVVAKTDVVKREYHNPANFS